MLIKLSFYLENKAGNKFQIKILQFHIVTNSMFQINLSKSMICAGRAVIMVSGVHYGDYITWVSENVSAIGIKTFFCINYNDHSLPMLPSEFRVYRNDMLEITFILLYATYLSFLYSVWDPPFTFGSKFVYFRNL